MALLLGIDGEMSDSDLSSGAVLLQIGLCDQYGNTFESLIGHSEGWYKSEEASAVHCIPDEDILLAQRAGAVDERLRAWLDERLEDAIARGVHTGLRPFIPLGWNVGGFDMPFVRKFLPLSCELISRRSLDLNALCHSFEQSWVTYQGERKSFNQWKQLAHDYAEKILGDTNWHDALYDAQAGMEAHNFLSGVFALSDYSPNF